MHSRQIHPIERSFLDCIEQEVLSDKFIERVLDGAFANNPDAERELLMSERARLVAEIENLTKGIALVGDIPSLAKALTERDKALKSIDAKLAKPVVARPRGAEGCPQVFAEASSVTSCVGLTSRRDDSSCST